MEPGTETKQDPLAGLKPGRIVYFVFDEYAVKDIENKRAASRDGGNAVKVGDVAPAMVVRVWSYGCVNLKVMLDGSDNYWATSVNFDGGQPLETQDQPAGVLFQPRTWHWMFDGQNTRYQPDRVEKA